MPGPSSSTSTKAFPSSPPNLLHTEIQNEDRQLVTLPNLFLVTHPVTTVRPSGTIVAARVSTAADADERVAFETRREQEEYFRSGEHLVRIARSVVWRVTVDDDVEIVPLIPWEILDNAPLQVLDFPEDE